MAARTLLTDAEERALHSLMTVTDELLRRVDRRLRDRAALSGADHAVLVRVAELGGRAVRLYELADGLRWEQSRLSHHLRRMEQRGLIIRSSCPSDGRGAVVCWTPAGKRALQAAAPAHAREVREVLFDSLTPAQVKTLAEICDTVRAHNQLN
jgi:DNA-binding MarR family transcriptional regulator